jgi:hypothetical protein
MIEDTVQSEACFDRLAIFERIHVPAIFLPCNEHSLKWAHVGSNQFINTFCLLALLFHSELGECVSLPAIESLLHTTETGMSKSVQNSLARAGVHTFTGNLIEASLKMILVLFVKSFEAIVEFAVPLDCVPLFQVSECCHLPSCKQIITH